MRKLEIHIGSKFNRLTVKEVLDSTGNGRRFKCQCECGNEIVSLANNIIMGRKKSCGCLAAEVNSVGANYKHGANGTPLYKVWSHMLSRCRNVKDKQYKSYGGRGITVCEAWLTAENFINWAKDKWEPSLQIDRIDNDKGYYPENCRFTSAEMNANNRRVRTDNKLGLTGVRKHKGKYQSYVGTKQNPFNGLVHLGFHDTVEEALEARNKFIIDNNLPHKVQKMVDVS